MPTSTAYTSPWLRWQGTQTNTITASNNTVWDHWVNSTGTTTASTITVPYEMNYDVTWRAWNQTSTAATQTYTIRTDVWNNWIQLGDGTGTVAAYATTLWRPQAAPLVRSEDEWAEIRAEQERQRAERDKLQTEARGEARKLMEFVLTKEQLAMYDAQRYFEVRGSDGGLFHVHHGTSGNIRQVVEGREINRLCVHPRMLDHRYDDGEGAGYLPTEDCLVAQALAIMHDESSLVNTANVHQGPRRHLELVRAAA